jgi:hypothetical protein
LDPGPTATKEEREKMYCLTFILYCSHQFQKIVNYFIFEQEQKKCEPIDKELKYFSQKIVTKLSETWVGDP